ncbi:MAG: hypothetical protein K2H14_06970 [Muribaculaceae bacterium]|nr:hypothetical protein [Muribaculaceae bacterium]
MKSLKIIFAFITLMAMASAGLTSCIEDAISTSAADQPVFSTDTVRMGELFTLDASPTQRFIVYNRHSKGLNISRIAFADDPDGVFRINVDGMSGREFNNVEIRAKDSIFVFVETTLPENGLDKPADILAHIEFLTNGVTSKMPVKATGRDAVRLKGDVRFAGDDVLEGKKPIHVYDSLVVEQGGRLTIKEGVELYFHENARVVVHGTLNISGTAENPVNMTGHRTGFVAASIPYEIMSGQWEGIEFTPTSRGNVIAYASIRNSTSGLVLNGVTAENGSPGLTLVNSQVRNTKGYVIDAFASDLTVAGCELADASEGIVRLVAGNHIFNHCTIANYYLFTALGGPAVQLGHLNEDFALEPDEENGAETEPIPYLTADFSNCIIYGNGTDLSHGDLDGTEVYLRRCLLKSKGEDDEHFINCLWDEDPLYYTERENYIFDYRLRPESPAIGTAQPELTLPLTTTDFYGTPRTTPSIGAYEVTPEKQ